MSRRLGPSAVRRAARGEAVAKSPVRGAAEGCSGPAQRFETTYRRASENFHRPLSSHTRNPRDEHNDGNNGAAQGSKPNRGLAPVTASGLLPREDDAVRPQCANNGHWNASIRPKAVGKPCAKIKIFRIGQNEQKRRPEGSWAPLQGINALRNYMNVGARRSFRLRR
jgi:hypothetical protein